jgi:hypothetical protein
MLTDDVVLFTFGRDASSCETIIWRRIYQHPFAHQSIVYSKYSVIRSIDNLLKSCNIYIATNMPKAVSRKAGPQAARSAPYPAPSAPTATTTSNDAPNTSSSSSSSNGPLTARSTNLISKKPTPATAPAQPESFLELTLPGEADHAVPVYDSCAQIRAKIKKLLEKPQDKPEKKARPGAVGGSGAPKAWTAKAFCAAVGVSTSSYAAFMKKTGHMGGAENHTYYGAYVFFEKKRVFEGAKKSAARMKMESELVVACFFLSLSFPLPFFL